MPAGRANPDSPGADIAQYDIKSALFSKGDNVKIIIAGDGKVGSALTKQLAKEGHDLTLIDSNPKVLEASVELYDVMAIHGNCASMSTLYQAGIRDTDLLIAATSADELNLLCCMTAHGLNPKLQTIARIRNPEYTDQIFKMRELFALSMIVNPEKQAAREIERLLKYPGFLKRDTFAKGRVEIVELRVTENSKLCNIVLNDMERIVKCKVLICAVLRSGHAITPNGDFVLQTGDRIFVTASRDDLMTLMKSLGIFHKVKSVIICGGGRVSYYLAKALEKSGIIVQLIEQDPQRCLQLSEQLPYTSIIQGDASNEVLLDSVGLSDCDALITATGMDELNMIVSLYGHNCGVSQTITKIGRLENRHLTDILPLGSIISPKELCCSTIIRYVRAMENQTGAAVSVHTIADGQIEAMEFLVERSTLHCGVPLKNLQLRKNVLLVCILHRAELEIPNGESTFEVGDSIILATSNREVIYQLNDIFV